MSVIPFVNGVLEGMALKLNTGFAGDVVKVKGYYFISSSLLTSGNFMEGTVIIDLKSNKVGAATLISSSLLSYTVTETGFSFLKSKLKESCFTSFFSFSLLS